MFEALSDRLGKIFRGLKGRGRITEANVAEVMREIRTALLEADVTLELARKFCDEVQSKAIGARVTMTLGPAEVMVQIVHDGLIRIRGPADPRIEKHRPCA